MKIYPLWIVCIFLFIGFTPNSYGQGKKDTIILTKETPDGVIKIQLSDLEDLSDARIDSLIGLLDAKTTNDSTTIYGHSLFQNKFEVIDDEVGREVTKVPSDYVLAQGDEIAVSIFGTSQFTGKYVIDERGFIYPEEIPSIFLQGLTLAQGREIIMKTFDRFFLFQRDQIAINLSSPREILVNIFGEVKKPGSYTLSALNSSFQALYNAGGPKQSGSVRNIKVINDGVTSNLDVYSLMVNPEKNDNLQISENTLINVPFAEKIISVTGEVKRPMLYELKDNEGILSLIKFAGGLTPKAFKKNVTIVRYENDQKNVIDIDLESLLRSNKDLILLDGDLVNIPVIANKINNVVNISGSVLRPGNYNLNTTSALSDLLEKAILNNSAKTDVIFLRRKNKDATESLITLNAAVDQNFKLQDGDKIQIDDLSEFVDQSTIAIKGAVRNGLIHPFDAERNMTILQAIELAGGLQTDAAKSAYILRTSPFDKNKKEYIKVDLEDAMAFPDDKTKNPTLEPNDECLILNNTRSSESRYINIKGAVRFPNEFEFASNLEASDLINLAGGFKTEASLLVDVYRLIIQSDNSVKSSKVASLSFDKNLNLIGGASSDFTLEPGDELVARSLNDYEDQAFVTINGEIRSAGEYALLNDNERLMDIVNRAGGFTKQGFPAGISVQRNNRALIIQELGSGSGNPILLDGDIIFVPKNEDLVFIDMKLTKAAELYPEKYDSTLVGVKYKVGKKANWYLSQFAGGAGYTAKSKDIYVLQPNGSLQRSKKQLFGLFYSYPKVPLGSTVGYGVDYDKINSLDEFPEEEKKRIKSLRKGVIINIDKEGGVKEKQVSSQDN